MDSNDDFSFALKTALSKEYHVTICNDGETAADLLRTLRPEILVLDLILPKKDGLAILEEIAPNAPPVVLCVSTLPQDYVFQAAADLGIGYILLKPCPLHAVVARLSDMVKKWEHPKTGVVSPQTIAAKHLDILGVPAHLDGYTHLYVGLPLFAQDPRQCLSKEFYPAVASICGNDDYRQVERSIRDAITAAWKKRDKTVWAEYFPGYKKAPSNKVFLARLAQELNKDK